MKYYTKRARERERRSFVFRRSSTVPLGLGTRTTWPILSYVDWCAFGRSARPSRASTPSSSDWEAGMGDVLTQHDVREQFFAIASPAWGNGRVTRWSVARRALPTANVLAGDIIVDGPHSFGLSAAKAGAAPERAFLIAVTHEGDRFIDIAAWRRPGTAQAVAQAAVGHWGRRNRSPSLVAEGALPVWRSPLNWLRAGRDGIVIIRPEAAASLLDGAGPLLAEDVAHARALRELLTRTGPRILLRAPSARAA